MGWLNLFSPRGRRRLLETQPVFAGAGGADLETAPSCNSSRDYFETAHLKVEGLMCAACVSAVENGLLAMSGVDRCTVSLMGKVGHVRFDKRLTDAHRIVEAVGDLGFSAELHDATGGAVEDVKALQRAQEHEVSALRRRLAASLIFTLPVLVIDKIAHMTAVRVYLLAPVVPGLSVCTLVACLLTTPVQFVFGAPFYAGAYQALKRGGANMDVLIVLGTTSAYVYSIVFMLVAVSTGGKQGLGMEMFETSATLISTMILGAYLQAQAKGRASEAIATLLQLQPPRALRVDGLTADTLTPEALGLKKGSTGGSEPSSPSRSPVVEVDVSVLMTGDVVKVLPGSRMPADGVVLGGGSAVDESMLSGEVMPLPKARGDTVVGGTINGSGVLWVQVGAVGQGSVLAQIMATVANAQLRKPRIQAFADQLAAYFVPTVVSIAVLTWVVWGTIAATGVHIAHAHGDGGGAVRVDDMRLRAFMFGCAVLVVACPCALGLATPTAVMVGSGVGAQQGVLFKGGDVLEAASSVDAVLFDKTGTLTTGALELAEILTWGRSSDATSHGHAAGGGTTEEERVLQLAASAELASEHPVGRALRNAAVARALPLTEPTDSEATAGHGLCCRVGELAVHLGNRAFLRSFGHTLTSEQEAAVADLEVAGRTVVLMAQLGAAEGADAPPHHNAARMAATAQQHEGGREGGREGGSEGGIIGALAVTDTLRPEAAGVVRRMRAAGVRVWMVSGDNERTAAHVARVAGIAPENVIAGVPPDAKAERVRMIQELGLRAVFVGDGVNDAPALAQADVGIAIGSGTGVAIEAADVVLMRSSLRQVEDALSLARAVVHRIRLNFVWAAIFNVVGIPMAAGLLYGPFGWYLPPMYAGVAMALSSVSVITSSLMLRCHTPPSRMSSD